MAIAVRSLNSQTRKRRSVNNIKFNELSKIQMQISKLLDSRITVSKIFFEEWLLTVTFFIILIKNC